MTLSIVIPCYNHGAFIQDALDSLPDHTDLSFEVIIVNDGSTDKFTIAKLEELEKEGYNVISHENRGLSYSRNIGIENAAGKFILPLDSDNKIIPSGIIHALELLEKNNYDIVYGKPLFFGEDIPSRKFVPRPFEGDELFFGNYIDACCVFKKTVWSHIGGYDEKMQGNEDWEFWIRAYLGGFKFHYLDEYSFEYRIVSDSMLGAIVNSERKELNHQYITQKHHKAHIEAFARNYTYSKIYRADQRQPLRSVLKYLSYIFK